MRSNQILSIGLLWHSANSDNLGVGALTAAHIAILEDVADRLDYMLRFKILGWSDARPSYIDGSNIEIVPFRPRDLLRLGGLYTALRGCDVVLDISAGDSFADIYGMRRFIFNILAKANVLLARRPLILSPQTIGPFRRRWARLLAGFFVRSARKVVTRDTLSTAYLCQMGFGYKVAEVTDVAFRLPYDPPQPKTKGGPIRVGLNISGLLFNGGYDRDNMFSLVADYQKLARASCAHFGAISGCELHLISHVISEGIAVEDDYRVAETLAGEFTKVTVAPRFASPSEAKSYIATMDFFAGSRMHACIAAFSSGVPVLPIAYSRKFSGLFRALGYDFVADCTIHSADEILHMLINAFEQRDNLRVKVQAGRKAAESKLRVYENLLSECLREIASWQK
jgi:polysaccharide pyruvyl transferase WcaK-like protein